MDARARLQRYLEQRRELGESELVLDAMSVEDVMALVGAKTPSRSSGKSAREGSASASTPPSPASSAPRATPPTAPQNPPTPSPELPRGESRPDESAGPTPATPAVRFDPNAQTDWRQALRDTRPASANDSNNADATRPANAASRGPTAEPARDVVLPSWLESVGWAGGLDVRARALHADVAEPANAISQLPDLDAIAQHIRACTRCALHTGARNAVPGEGNALAELVCVGEGPGQSEDEQGLPFVGESGQLLTKILGAIHLSRDAVYICNVVKHRPPGNRDPLPEEVHACEPYLQRQLALVKPRIILALGRFAAQTLLGTTTPLGKLRERIHMYNGVPVIATYHPAALLRNDAWKRPTWEDVKVARRILDLSRTADGGTTAG